MKILYFSRGLTVHDRRFLAALTESEHEIFFMRLESDSEVNSATIPTGVREISGGIDQALAELEPDLVHAGPLHSAGWQVAQSGYQPLVVMSWGSDILYEAEHDEVVYAKVAETLEAAAALIADCQAVADKATDYGFLAERIVIFPWGVNLESFDPSTGDKGLRAKLGWEDAFVLLHNRVWEKLYDPLTVVRAFTIAAQQDEKMRLILPGAGGLEAEIKKSLRKANMEARVHMPGRVDQDELPHYYCAADLYVSASRSDGSSVSLMEALACGRPALVSDIPGNREWVLPGQNGWLFSVGDVHGLAARILAAPAADLSALGGAARAVAEERADWQRNKAGIWRAYELALAAAGADVVG